MQFQKNWAKKLNLKLFMMIIFENNFQKENLKASLFTLDDKIDFSTVNINIQEVAKVTATETIETTFGTKVKNAIADSLYFFTDTLQELIIALIYLLPFLVIIAVVVIVGVRFYRKYKKNNKLQ